MTVFQLKQLASTSVHAAADAIGWNYDRAELIADGVIHAIGVFCGIVAATVLVVLTAVYADATNIVGVSIYVAGLLSMLVLSASYNLWPVSPVKWLLRRFDHSAIYLLIAATYTPFLAQLDGSPLALPMIVLVWTAAVTGIAIKVFLPGRFDRLAIVFYLAIGWSGIVLVKPLVATLPTTSIALIVAGGIVYSCGVIFFAWKGLRFHNAVWHGFVVTGAGLHLAAMVDCLVINRL